MEPAALQDIHSTPYSLSLWQWPGTDMEPARKCTPILWKPCSREDFPARCPVISVPFTWPRAVAGGLLFYRLSSWQGLVVSMVMCLLAAACASILFRQYWLLPTANVQLAVMLSYTGILGLRLTGEERERARIRNIFGRYVADEVVEKLLAVGNAAGPGGRQLPGNGALFRYP